MWKRKGMKEWKSEDKYMTREKKSKAGQISKREESTR